MSKEKVYILERPGKYSWSRTFKKEGALLNAIKLTDSYPDNCIVRVFEEVSSFPAKRYKSGYIAQKEREEQFSMVVDDELTTKHLFAIKCKLKEICEEIDNQLKSTKNVNARHYRYYDPKDRIPKSILNQFKINGLNKSTFNTIIGNSENKKYLLFDISQEQEWYEILLRAHNFTKLRVSEYGKKVEGSQQALDNFKNAKEVIRKERISANKDKKKSSLAS